MTVETMAVISYIVPQDDFAAKRQSNAARCLQNR